jgi:hypothetical protein
MGIWFSVNSPQSLQVGVSSKTSGSIVNILYIVSHRMAKQKQSDRRSIYHYNKWNNY